MLEVLRGLTVTALIAAGLFFMVVSPIGMIRFPDFFTRVHAAGKCDSLGQAFILLGCIIHEGLSLNVTKLALLILFIYLLTPTATHAIVKAAYLVGEKERQAGGERA